MPLDFSKLTLCLMWYVYSVVIRMWGKSRIQIGKTSPVDQWFIWLHITQGAFINDVTQFWPKNNPPPPSVTLKWVFCLHHNTECHKTIYPLFAWRYLFVQFFSSLRALTQKRDHWVCYSKGWTNHKTRDPCKIQTSDTRIFNQTRFWVCG